MNDINKIMKKIFIKQICRDLIDNGSKLRLAGHFEEANKAFSKVLEIDPSHPGIFFNIIEKKENKKPDFESGISKDLKEFSFQEKDSQISHDISSLFEDEEPLSTPKSENIRDSDLITLTEMNHGKSINSPEFFENDTLVFPEITCSSFGASIEIPDDNSDIKIDPLEPSVKFNQEKQTGPSYDGQISTHIQLIEENREIKNPENQKDEEIKKLHLAVKQIEIDKNFDDAIQCYSDILQLNDKDVLAWDKKGYCYEMTGRFDEALTCYETALNIDLCCDNAWYHKGAWFANNCEFEKSLIYFDKAITINPNIEKIWYDKGYALERLGLHKEAIDCFDKFLESNPTSVDGWINKAYNYKQLNENISALECYNTALNIRPQEKEIWYLKGSLLEKIWDGKNAILCYEKAIEIDPNYIDALNAKEKLSRQIKDEKTTQENGQMFTQKSPVIPDSFYSCIYFGISLMGSEKFEESLQYFIKAQKIDPTNSDPWLFKFLCYKKMNSPIEAKYCENKIDFDNFLEHAINFFETNDYEKSLKYFDAIIEISPSYADLWVYKGACLEQLGKSDEAQFCYSYSKKLENLK